MCGTSFPSLSNPAESSSRTKCLRRASTSTCSCSATDNVTIDQSGHDGSADWSDVVAMVVTYMDKALDKNCEKINK